MKSNSKEAADIIGDPKSSDTTRMLEILNQGEAELQNFISTEGEIQKQKYDEITDRLNAAASKSINQFSLLSN